MSSRISSGRLLAAVALVAALTLSWAGAAFAATPDPTLGLAALRTRLEASPSGTLDGYLKTVVRGSDIETIPVEVMAVSGDTPDSLILFVAKGDKIASFGGIVSGMSGSPIYVEDGGVDKVIGALSYGDMFTLGGSGLATPIESMLDLTTDYAPRVDMLSSPVFMSGRLIDRVVVSSDPASLKNVRAPGALVAKPLTAVFIGGLKPKGRTYSNLRASLEAAGLSVMPLDVPLSAGTSTFTTALDPGSSVAALATRGDIWVGGLGTVTWADEDRVLAFGHPAFFTGESDLYMCNAWVTGVWPSTYVPYKMGYPTAVRGTITQDRNAGIMGELGAPPAEAPLTASAVDTGSGDKATSAVYASSRFLDTRQFEGLPAAAGSIAAARLFDAISTAGSARTTTTVRVSDGTREYTVSMANLVDDALDVPSVVGNDAEWAVSSLLSVLDENVEQPHIISTNVQSAVSTTRAAARIVGLSLEEPLHEGDNEVTVSLLAYGVAATQTVETTLTLPEGTPLAGTITASGVLRSDMWWDEEDPTQIVERTTVADIVDDLNSQLPNNSVVVSFVAGGNDGSEGDPSLELDPPDAIEATASASWVVSGSADLQISQITARVAPALVSYRGSTALSGYITGPSDSATVEVYGRPFGSSTERLLASERAEFVSGEGFYYIYLPNLTGNTALRVHIDGGPGYSPAEATVSVRVRAKVSLSASALHIRYGRRVTLTARVSPRTAHGSVRFQYYDAGQRRWRTIGTKSLRTGSTYATAAVTWAPRWGNRRWRAIYSGDTHNVSAISPGLTTSAR